MKSLSAFGEMKSDFMTSSYTGHRAVSPGEFKRISASPLSTHAVAYTLITLLQGG